MTRLALAALVALAACGRSASPTPPPSSASAPPPPAPVVVPEGPGQVLDASFASEALGGQRIDDRLAFFTRSLAPAAP